ncbi:MAG TPA: DUF4493 domain-containing protein [Bacteroides mediterraneensis]|uniref:DUF4493 domain-containing protein n=1 Tax=Bacteroides mediterraneensis TaxID=1841856 RepID=UPI0026EEBFBB|nr:DUF4493 domain-containing protein [Bacteroides mediterraneensis]HJH65442.1 DUF4493 domain-containing protein [Bacteroides mediterraneensis]
MKKNIVYILLGIFLLASCQQENEIPSGKGYLSVEGIELQSQVVTEVASRAVDESLTVDLYKGEQFVRTLTPEEMQNKIELEPATDYMLKAYSANYGEESAWDNETKGEPVYYKEVSFVVTEGATTAVKVQVPMVTFAVCLNLTEVTGDWLQGYTFTVTSGNRSVALQDGETAYFPYSDSFNYQLSVTNSDGESKEQSGSWGTENGKTVEQNTVYTVTYNWATQKLAVE